MVTILYTIYLIIQGVWSGEALDTKIKKKVFERNDGNKKGYIDRYFEYPTNLLAASIYGVVYTIILTIDLLIVQVVDNWEGITIWVSGFYESNEVVINSIGIVIGVALFYRMMYNTDFVKVWVEDFTGKDEDIRREIRSLYKGMLTKTDEGDSLITFVKELSPQVTNKELKANIERVGYHNKWFINKLNRYIQDGAIKTNDGNSDLIIKIFTTNYYEESLQKIAFNKQMGIKNSVELEQFKSFIRHIEAGYLKGMEIESETTLEEATKGAIQIIKQIQGVF